MNDNKEDLDRYNAWKQAQEAERKEEGRAMLAIWGLWICVGVVIGIPIGKFLL